MDFTALRPWIVLLLMATVVPPCIAVQNVETGFLDRTVTVGAREFRYQVYVPEIRSTEEQWPVILFLHGSGERGEDGVLPTAVGLGPAIRRSPSRYPAVVVFPQAPAESTWVGMPAQIAMAALDRALAEFPVDGDRVYLVGMSLGGNGAWHLAYRWPGRFTAVAVICGYVTPPGIPNRKSAVPAADGDPLAALARRLNAIPTWVFHGEVDPVVPVEASRRTVETLRAARGNVQYTEFLGMGHDVWDAVFSSPRFVEWLFSQRRRR